MNEKLVTVQVVGYVPGSGRPMPRSLDAYLWVKVSRSVASRSFYVGAQVTVPHFPLRTFVVFKDPDTGLCFCQGQKFLKMRREVKST